MSLHKQKRKHKLYLGNDGIHWSVDLMLPQQVWCVQTRRRVLHFDAGSESFGPLSCELGPPWIILVQVHLVVNKIGI